MTPASNPKPPVNEQIADLVLKLLKPGGITVGGIGALWLLFAQSDVPKAIASAGIGVLISYGAKLLQPIHEGNQRRLEQVGKTVDTKIDEITSHAIAAATRFEDKYLLCQASDCQSFRSEGMAQYDRIFVPLLKEVFVPLGLDASSNLPGLRAIALKEMVDNGLSIWDFLAKTNQEATFRQIAILAWGGSGKTTLLRHIAYLYGIKQPPRNAPKLIPVLLVLRKYRDLLAQDNPPNLPELITTHHIPSLPGASELQVPTNWAKEMLKRGDALVMFDGFDEVAKPQRPAVARWINEQMRRYGKSKFIVTSRPKAYREQDVGDRLELSTPLWVKDFNPNQRQTFVENWYLCQERYATGGRDTPDVRQVAQQAATELLSQIEARPELQDLAKNPLLLNLIVTFHRRYPGAELPKRRVELYREICLLQLRDRPAARRLETLLTQCETQTILQMLALSMMRSKRERIDRPTLLKGLATCLQQQGEIVAAEEFLEQIVQISELLVQQEDEYEFAHLSFQEYLAATQIAQRKQESFLYDHFHDDWWKPTILLYAAQVNPSKLIQEMMQRNATDLAYVCWQDTTKHIDLALQAQLATLKFALRTSRYQALEDYLKAGEWAAADKETYRLMIKAVGKEEGQYFESEELLNFPCEELLAIDRLWVKYSNGHFGFSIQKKIYVGCGATLDGQYPGHEIWHKFCDRIGWSVEGDTVDYSKVRKNPLFSCDGELPCFWGSGWLGWWVLLSRTEICKL